MGTLYFCDYLRNKAVYPTLHFCDYLRNKAVYPTLNFAICNLYE